LLNNYFCGPGIKIHNTKYRRIPNPPNIVDKTKITLHIQVGIGVFSPGLLHEPKNVTNELNLI
jgi:hypothetical protein